MIEAEGDSVPVARPTDVSTCSTAPSPKAGTLEAMLPPVSKERRDELHKKFALWIVRNNRPLKIGESDPELRDIFDFIFQGGYTPPTYKLVTQYILELSVEGRQKVKAELLLLISQGVLPSIAGDLWSEGGIAIFGILIYWLDENMQYHEKLLGAIPFGDVRHTGPEIARATKICAANMGVGEIT
ncbi:hypothetical protein CYMTET_4441 [Cymbomonas tetramitiformis]|uniref:Uncharacterized protein n=1 Tax=Cymbomonas tetramitiformis TaxID=36881 RepID=A0AAE0H1D8_9CHLO|nr:hypothetical protein CYMTET_4441 [Cymbomonas tetramitiformis]